MHVTRSLFHWGGVWKSERLGVDDDGNDEGEEEKEEDEMEYRSLHVLCLVMCLRVVIASQC